MGAHQKINRVARKHIERIQPRSNFPRISKILYFEGGNGPDGVKRKSPGKDEPWHYIQPFDEQDVGLLGIIEHHYTELVTALKHNDEVRAAFEAAWLSHAIVDGLTPAHHYPYEKKLIELRGGQSIDTRTTFKEKVLLPGETRSKQVHNNWKMWGPRGIFTMHWTFEWGVATLMAPLRLKQAKPSEAAISHFIEQGVTKAFLSTAQEIAAKEYYDRFATSGWTRKLASEIKRELIPVLVETVTIAWCAALREAKTGV